MSKFIRHLMVVFLLTGLMLLFAGNAYAYLDPGTGSMILQGILGGLAAAVVVARLYWHRLLSFFGFRKDKPRDELPENKDSADTGTQTYASDGKYGRK